MLAYTGFVFIAHFQATLHLPDNNRGILQIPSTCVLPESSNCTLTEVWNRRRCALFQNVLKVGESLKPCVGGGKSNKELEKQAYTRVCRF